MSQNTKHESILERQINRIKNFMESGNIINNTDLHGNTYLHRVILDKSDKMIIQFLLEQGANVNCQNEFGDTPLHLAVNMDLETVTLLTERGADLNITNIYGYTPLHRAIIEQTDNQIAKYLIQHDGVDIMAKDRRGSAFLHHAAENPSKIEITKLLIELGLDPNVRNNNKLTPLHKAVKNRDNIENVKLLLDNGADIDARCFLEKTPIMIASSTAGNIEIVKYLFCNGADLEAKDCNDQASLFMAISAANNSEIIEFILENGAKINQTDKHGRTPFAEAMFTNFENVNTLLENGADFHLSSQMINKIYENNWQKFHFRKSLDIIVQHVVKLWMLGVVSDTIFETWRFTRKLQSEEMTIFIDACRNEAEELNEIICSNHTVNFSDLITKDLGTVACILSNEVLTDKLSQVDIEELFPIYSSLIKRKIQRSIFLTQQMIGKELF